MADANVEIKLRDDDGIVERLEQAAERVAALTKADPLVCLLGPLALTGPQLDYIEDRRREGGSERRSQHEVVLAILGEADWDIPIPDERPRTHYQTQGELRIPVAMLAEAESVYDPVQADPDTWPTGEDIRRRINDVLCWAIDDALGDGQQDGP